MGFILFRLIIFIGVVWLGIRLLKAFNRKKLESQQQTPQGNERPQQMVQCRYCNLHLPQNDAVKHESLWFCCHEHRQHFLDKGPEQ